MLYSHEVATGVAADSASLGLVRKKVVEVISSEKIGKSFWALDATHAVQLAKEFFEKNTDKLVYIYYGRILIIFRRAQNDGEKLDLSIASITDLSGDCIIVESHTYTAQQVENQLVDALSIET